MKKDIRAMRKQGITLPSRLVRNRGFCIGHCRGGSSLVGDDTKMRQIKVGGVRRRGGEEHGRRGGRREWKGSTSLFGSKGREEVPKRVSKHQRRRYGNKEKQRGFSE